MAFPGVVSSGTLASASRLIAPLNVSLVVRFLSVLECESPAELRCTPGERLLTITLIWVRQGSRHERLLKNGISDAVVAY